MLRSAVLLLLLLHVSYCRHLSSVQHRRLECTTPLTHPPAHSLTHSLTDDGEAVLQTRLANERCCPGVAVLASYAPLWRCVAPCPIRATRNSSTRPHSTPCHTNTFNVALPWRLVLLLLHLPLPVFLDHPPSPHLTIMAAALLPPPELPPSPPLRLHSPRPCSISRPQYSTFSCFSSWLSCRPPHLTCALRLDSCTMCGTAACSSAA